MKQDMIVILDLGSTENTVLAREIRSLGVGKVIKIDDLSLFFFHNDSPICHLARQHLFTAGPPKAFSISFLQTAAALKQICCYFL